MFSRQIEVFGGPGDLLIALSGSGKSLNILKAMQSALSKGMNAILIKGAFGDARAAVDSYPPVIEHGSTMQEAEEYQLKLGHEIMLQLKKEPR